MEQLPENDYPWPPPELRLVLPKLREWDAWYGGDVSELSNFYGAQGHQAVRPSLRRDGLFGAIQRFFWGQPTPIGAPRTKVHVPIAADISAASADLLFGAEVSIDTPDMSDADRARIDDVLEENVWSGVLLEAADLGSALGSSYLRVTWDEEVSDKPIIGAIPADQAIPSFRFGRLWTVAFWQEVRRDGQKVWRHLELHGRGFIEHALYEGTVDKLGRRVPLQDSELTAGLAVDAESRVATGTDLLTAQFVPNMRPQRGSWRKDPLATHLGRSDYDGVEPLMDALDEVWTSWMRDVRLAKARIIVAQSMLRNVGGPGDGSVFDLDREVYQAMNVLETEGRAPLMTPHQFQIRAVEHEATATQLLQQIFRGAGYSGQTFGVVEAGAATATEVDAREARSYNTRQKKARYWGRSLQQFLQAVLAVDRTVFRSGAGESDVKIEFPDPSPSARELAQTLQLLESAKAVSTATKVRMLHPDWDDMQVDEEVELIGGGSVSPEDALLIADSLPEPVEDGAPTDDPEQVPPQ